MPANRTDHVVYTRNEWETEPYFLKVLEILQSENILSYLDLGANVGEVCNVLFEKIPTLESAYLVEPQAENFEFLMNHVISENRKIKSYPVGILYGKTAGELFIDPDWQNPGSFALTDYRDNFQPAGETVELTTLENLKIPHVDFVKIDVEGSEYNIVENSSYLTGCKYIDIEFHTHSIPSVKFCQKNLPTHSIVLSEGGHILLRKND